MLGWAAIMANTPMAQSGQVDLATNEVRIVEFQGEVEVSPRGATTWVLTQTNQVLHPFDRVRTRVNSRAALRWSNQSVVAFGASTELEILPPHRPDAESGLSLIRGIISFFHREQPGRLKVITRGAMAGVEGTEFMVTAAGDGDAEHTTISVIDGKVLFGNEKATLLVTNGQQAAVDFGQAPVRTAGFQARNLLQWCFYYPGVLDLADLSLTTEERETLAASLAAYSAGDLLQALAQYPSSREPHSGSERAYYAALLLSVGQVERAEVVMSALSDRDTSEGPRRIASALRQLIAAVKGEAAPAMENVQLATEFLANSYYEQSSAVRQISLERALLMAKQAVAISPAFAFGWERVAELEFSFGRTSRAIEALEKSLALASKNAQGLALKGFLLTAQNNTRDAIGWFDRALAQDSALGNAWLGRGLSRIRLGDEAGGREDLLMAAALEPQRALPRSYLGKAYAQGGDFPRAYNELQIAKMADPNDPTAWLYSGLLKQQDNRINEAIRDLEHSQELNDNRSVYRSMHMLDQDRAVRSANLAAIYQDAGMFDVSIREAARAVNYDYANYSAHLFLANSYAELRGQDLLGLRYETPAQTEYLIANLLAPVSAGTLSPTISQQEYSKLFERNGFGVVSDTEYLSRGAWRQTGAQYGTFDRFNYDFEADYRSDPGQRVNNDVQMRMLYLTTKLQIAPEDTLSLSVTHTTVDSGDLVQYYTTNMANPHVRVREKQEPIASLGYHHEWAPGAHTLVLVGRLDDTLSYTNPSTPTLVAFRPDVDPDSMPGITKLTGVQGIDMHENLRGNLEIYSGEVQQIWEQSAHTIIVGSRIQYGHFDTANLQLIPDAVAAVFPMPPAPAAQQDARSLFKRFSVYGYQQWQITDPLQLIGGLSYDLLAFPENFRYAPISAAEQRTDQFSPKAGVIWSPFKGTTVRFGYTRSLGGASLDQSFQLEPSQVAGFVQSFRSIIPESLAGANAGAMFETYGVSLEQKLQTGTYLGVSGEILNSQVHRTVGAFDVLPDEVDFAIPSGLREHLDYSEKSLVLTANQLLDETWSFGMRYRLSHAELKDNLIDVPDGLIFRNFEPRQQMEAVLQQLTLFAIFNHPCGFFAEQEAVWYAQRNGGYTPNEPGDEFWQLNAFLGYRFPRRRAQMTLGVLNLADQDYRLNPLNLYTDLPRSRTVALRLQLSF